MSGKAICTCGHPWEDHGSNGTGDLTRCLYHHDVDRPCPCRVFVNRDFTQVHGTRESSEERHQFNVRYDDEVPERLIADEADQAILDALADVTAPRETVDHPAHYGGAHDPYEHIKVCEALGWGYHIGNCTKYLWRLGRKDPSKVLEDAKKARWYLDRYIQTLEQPWTPNE